MEDLTTLPGVGRKTANVVRSVAFDLPGLPVDTHVGRLTRRLGLTEQTDPVKVETEVGALVPAEEWGALSLRLILHGRRVCLARPPRCEECLLADICPSAFLPSALRPLCSGAVPASWAEVLSARDGRRGRRRGVVESDGTGSRHLVPKSAAGIRRPARSRDGARRAPSALVSAARRAARAEGDASEDVGPRAVSARSTAKSSEAVSSSCSAAAWSAMAATRWRSSSSAVATEDSSARGAGMPR